jgi:hypothetical protein
VAFFACAGNISATTTVAITKPASMLTGDVLIICECAYRSTSAAPGTATIANTGTGGAAWSSVTNQTTGTYYKTAYAYKTLATDGDGSVTAYTWTSTSATRMAAALIVLRDRKNQAPTPISNTAYITSDTNVRAAALTAAAADDLVWWGYNYRSTVQATAIPSGWTSGTVQTAGAAISGAMAYQQNVSAGTTGVVNGTVANAVTTKHAFMFAVQYLAPPVGAGFDPLGMSGFFGI